MGLLIAPSSQGVEPPANPAQFSTSLGKGSSGCWGTGARPSRATISTTPVAANPRQPLLCWSMRCVIGAERRIHLVHAPGASGLRAGLILIRKRERPIAGQVGQVCVVLKIGDREPEHGRSARAPSRTFNSAPPKSGPEACLAAEV